MCAAESYPQDEDSVRLLVMALLTVLGRGRGRSTDGLWEPVNAALDDLCDRYDKASWEARHAADRYYDPETGIPLAGLVALLAGFGAVTGDPGKPVITPLGRWAAAHLADGLPGLADPAMAGRGGDRRSRPVQRRGTAAPCRAGVAGGARLRAGRAGDPGRCGGDVTAFAQRSRRMVERLGEDALPAWREMKSSPHVGPHARAELAAWDQGPEPGDTDWEWLAVEAAAAALQDHGPDEALNRVWEGMPGADLDACLAAVQGTGHPDAAALARAVAEFAASGAPLSIEQVAELKVSLAHARPPVWRRVRLPAAATLADLHQVIQVLFGWDGDHLHLFEAGKKQYADQFTGLEGTGDEQAVRIRDVLTPGAKIGYTYDFGAGWEHEITLEQTTPRDPGQDYPVCVAFRGDSPVEYWSEEEPEEPEPFGQNEVNRRLAALGRQPA